MKVFNIPDENGGIIYKVQTPDGVWHVTDEQGNYLTESPTENKRERHKKPSKSEGRINLGVAFTPEEYKDFSDYINWRCIFKEKCTKGPFLVKMGKDCSFCSPLWSQMESEKMIWPVPWEYLHRISSPISNETA